MSDIEGAYNTDLLGLLHSARKHGAKAYTGTGTLSQIANAVGDYGHLPTFIERVREDFSTSKIKVQTPDSPVSQTMDKLVNLWLLSHHRSHQERSRKTSVRGRRCSLSPSGYAQIPRCSIARRYDRIGTSPGAIRD